MKHPFFTGTCTALVTPFDGNQINYPMLETLLKRQIDAGIDTVVLGGTTGESPTLSDSEKIALFRQGKEYAPGMKIICGTGSNNTAHAVLLSKAAEESGADALLLVAPYYNKGNPNGQFAHFAAVAESVHIPVILYNVPSRTGTDIPISVYKRLSEIENIVGVKEASTDIVKIARIRNACPETFSVWSGNDDLAVPAIAMGAQGLISVVSNVKPAQTKEMTDAALSGDFKAAAELQRQLLPLIETLFREVNPIPVKEAMNILGFDCGNCRLPLGQPTKETISELKRHLR